MNIVAKALLIATEAHKGQKRRDGTDYITHPIAVAELLDTDLEQVVALLHDIIEDTKVTADDLKVQGYPCNVVRSVLRLTKVKGQSYEDYLTNLVKDPIATKVKLADMFHNLSDSPTPKQKAKYLKAVPILLKGL